ncbi:MAG: phospho-N-acetylmuramoyl-pentapeptide-transferase, partial [bacterium]|nr:phospho-N-acetylmuramoyl-pentapeptide-transferase [bacterium]
MHQGKAGTPTMGGILILISILIPVMLLGDLSNRLVILMLIVTLWLGAVGFLDDYIKLVLKRSLGLTVMNKFFWQICLGVVVGLYLYYYPIIPNHPTQVYFPFLKDVHPELGWWYIP